MTIARLAFFTAASLALGGAAAPAVQDVGNAAMPLITTAFLEGPAATDGGDLYFTDLFNNRIWKRDRAGRLTIFRAAANYANGLAIDEAGALLAAEDGDPTVGTPPRITRTDLASGTVTVLADEYEGKPFQSPNDLVADGHGRVWFTDWARPDFLPAAAAAPGNPFGVYRIDRDGSIHRVLAAPQIEAPNGIMVSPDDRTLYLVESNRIADGHRRIMAYPIAVDGVLGKGRIFHDFKLGRSGDGMAIDAAGRLWVAAGLNAPRAGGETMDTRAGVHVFAPGGRLVRFVPIGEDLVTNIAFGGLERRTAFVTAGKTVFAVASDVPGMRR